jgi:hypothetical protein
MVYADMLGGGSKRVLGLPWSLTMLAPKDGRSVSLASITDTPNTARLERFAMTRRDAPVTPGGLFSDGVAYNASSTQSLNGSNSPAPAIATAKGRRICSTFIESACSASTSGNRR